MATITNLSFAITSSWDPQGMSAARADIDKFQAELRSMSNDRVSVQVEVQGVSKAQADVDTVAKDREATIQVKAANTATATASIDEVAKERTTEIKVSAVTGPAQAQLDALADSDKWIKMTARLDNYAEVRAQIDALAVEKEARVKAVAETTAAEAELAAAARDRDVQLKAKADTSSAESSFSGLTGVLSNHLLIAGALTAAFTGLGAVAALAGTAMMTALGGGVLAAGMAVIEMNKKMTDSQNQAMASAQAQMTASNKAVNDAQMNVTDTATKGAQAVVTANQGVVTAQQNVADTAQQGADSIRSANEEAATANQTLTNSEATLTQAYQDATRTLQDLQLQQSQTGDNAEAASIAVARARDALAKGPSASSTDRLLDERALRNGLALAIDHQNSVLEKNGQINQDADIATAKGIEGNKGVISAHQGVADAAQKAADAKIKVAEAEHKATEDNVKAQQELSHAVQNAANVQHDTAEANVKAQESLTAAIDNQTKAHAALNQTIAKGASAAHSLLSELAGFAQPLVQPMHDALASLQKQLSDMGPQITSLFANAAPLMQPFLDSVTGGTRSALPGFNTALQSMKDMMPGLVSGMSNLGQGVGDMFSGMSKSASSFGKIINDFGANFGTFLKQWGTFTGDIGPAGAKTLDNMGKGINAANGGILNGMRGALTNMSGAPSIIQSVFSGVGSIGQTALPAAGAMYRNVSSALAPALTTITPGLGDAAKGIFDIAGSAAKAFGPGLDTAARAIENIMQKLKPVIPLVQSLVSGMGGTFSMEMKILAPILEAVAIPIADILKGLTPLAPVIGIVLVAVKTWTIAQAALNLVMDTNPLVLIGLAIAALVGGIIYLATKTQFFQDIWRGLQVAFSATINWVTDMWRDVTGAFSSALEWIKHTWDTAWGAVKKSWDDFTAVLSLAWSIFWGGIKNVAMGIWDGITQGFHDFGAGINSALSGIVSLAKTVWDGIKKVFAEPLNVIIRFSNDTIGKIIPSAHMDPVAFADGGPVNGPGGPRDDKIHAMLSNGEFVTNAASTQKNLAALHHANNGGMIVPAYANGGEVGAPPAVQRALDWASSKNGMPYNAEGWIDCSGLASGIYDSLMNKAPKREFTTVSNFTQLGFNSGTGGMMEIGVLPKAGDAGHMAITLAGHHIESAGGGKGIQIDGSAWGADNPYFTDHYYLPGNMFSPGYNGGGANGGGSSGGGGGIMGVIGKAINVARNGVSDLFIKLTNPVLSGIPGVPGLGDPFKTMPKEFLTKGRNDIADLIRGHESSSSTPIGGVVPTGQHLDMIDQALALTNTPPPGSKGAWEAGMNTLIMRESGWNSAAQNNTDSNAAAGIPSKGLAQTIDPTFQSFAAPGHTNIWDPVSNIAASINYIKSRYGDISAVQQANANMPPRGYATGTKNAQPGIALVGENGPELIQSAVGSFIAMGQQAVGFKGGETVTPLNLKPNAGGNAPTSIPAPAGGTTPAPPPPSGGQQVGTQGSDSNGLLQQTGQKGATALQNFATANIQGAASDLGIPTDGNGFIPQLFTQSFNVGQQLAQNMQNHVGIFGNNSDTQGNNSQPTAQASAPGNVGSAGTPAPQQAAPTGDQHVHYHVADMNEAIKKHTQSLKIQAAGFHPFGNI